MSSHICIEMFRHPTQCLMVYLVIQIARNAGQKIKYGFAKRKKAESLGNDKLSILIERKKFMTVSELTERLKKFSRSAKLYTIYTDNDHRCYPRDAINNAFAIAGHNQANGVYITNNSIKKEKNMKVSELIKSLNQFPPDDEVKVLDLVENPICDDGKNIRNVYQIIGHDTASGAYIEFIK